MARNTKKEIKRKKKKKSGALGKLIRWIIIILLVLAVATVAYLKVELGNLTHYDIDTSREAICTSDNLKDYRNIVVLGVDTRDMSNFSGSRTDSIIIVSINTKTNEMNLISVYRDTLLNIKEVGCDKVTHAFAYGGPERTVRTLNENMDLNITEYVALNFRTVQKIVDGVGGIDIEIQEEEIDQMNTYLPDTAKYLKCEYEPITKAGKQHLDGVQAVTYSRIRHTAGGDYRRTERMRTVLTAVFNKVKHTSPAKIDRMMDDVLPEISTNMKPGDIIPLMFKLPFLDINDSIGWPYDKEGYTSPRTGTWFACPVTLESNVKELHQKAFYQEDYVPSESVKKNSSDICYITGYYGN